MDLRFCGPKFPLELTLNNVLPFYYETITLTGKMLKELFFSSNTMISTKTPKGIHGNLVNILTPPNLMKIVK